MRIGQTVKRMVVRKAFYSDEEDEAVEEELEVIVAGDPHTDDHGDGDSRGGRGGGLFAFAGDDGEADLHPDHRLALRSSLPLLRSRNAGVVVAVAKLHFLCGSQNSATNETVGKALVRIMRDRREIQYVVLQCISTVAQERPGVFRPYLSDFFIQGSDPVFNRLLKLQILTAVFARDDATVLLRELESYLQHGNAEFVSAAVRAVGRVVDVEPQAAAKCLDGLVKLLMRSRSPVVVGEIVDVLRQILQQNRSLPESAVALKQLVRLLLDGRNHKSDGNDAESSSSSSRKSNINIDAGDGSSAEKGKGGVISGAARASVVWLVSEFPNVLGDVTPDVLRLLALKFAEEALDTRTQILNLACKLSLRVTNSSSSSSSSSSGGDPQQLQQLCLYVLEMARYDLDTDLRDRARFMTALLGLKTHGSDSDSGGTDSKERNDGTADLTGTDTGRGNGSSSSSSGGGEVTDDDAMAELHEHAQGILLSPKLPPVTVLGSVDVDGQPHFSLGSLSAIVGHTLPGYQAVPRWVGGVPDGTIRDVAAPASVYFKDKDELSGSSGGGGSSKVGKGGASAFSDTGGIGDFYGDDSGSSSSDSDSDSDESSSNERSSAGGDSDNASNNNSDSSDSDSDDSSSDSDSGSSSSDSDTPAPTQRMAAPFSAPKRSSTSRAGAGASGASHSGSQSHMHQMQSQGASSSSASASTTTAGLLGDDYTAIYSPAPPLGSAAPTAVAAAAAAASSGSDNLLGDLLATHPPATAAAAAAAAEPPSVFSAFDGLLPPTADVYGSGAGAGGGDLSSELLSFGAGLADSAAGAGAGMMRSYTSLDSSSSPAPSPTAASCSAGTLSDARVLLKAELCHGLQLSAQYSFGSAATTSSTIPFSTHIVLTFANKGDQPIRRVRINCTVQCSPLPQGLLELLIPGSEVQVPMELLLVGCGGTTVKTEVRSDKGSYTALLKPAVWEVLSPLQMNNDSFAAARRLLGGFNEASKTFTADSLGLPSGGDAAALKAVHARILTRADVAAVVSSGDKNSDSGSGELKYAALCRTGPTGEGHKVLLVVTLEGVHVKLQAHCDDAVLSSQLLPLLKE